jgi:hypothetical protein
MCGDRRSRGSISIVHLDVAERLGTNAARHRRPPAGYMHFITNPQDSSCVIEQTCATTGCGSPPKYSQATRISQLSSRIPLTAALFGVTTGLVNPL